MNPTDKIYIAGHRGLVGSALMRLLTRPAAVIARSEATRQSSHRRHCERSAAIQLLPTP